MNSKPTVSVIIPTYNMASFLPRSIGSVLHQTFKNFEVVIIDDASTDNTSEVVQTFQDPRIRYIRHQTNKALADTRNIGIKVAKGEYIGFLDADDEWLPKKLEKQIDKFQQVSDDVGLVYAHCLGIFEPTGEIQTEFKSCYSDNIFDEIRIGCFLTIQTALARKVCFEKVGFFDNKLPAMEDWDMWFRLAKQYKFDYVPEFLAKYYVHGNQLSSNLNKRIIAWQKFLGKHRKDFVDVPHIYSMHLDYLARLCCFNGKAQKGRRYFLKSIKFKPIQKSGYIHLLLSLLSTKLHKIFIDRTLFPLKNGVRIYK